MEVRAIRHGQQGQRFQIQAEAYRVSMDELLMDKMSGVGRTDSFYFVDLPPDTQICENTVPVPLKYYSNHPSRAFRNGRQDDPPHYVWPPDFPGAQYDDENSHMCDHSSWPVLLP